MNMVSKISFAEYVSECLAHCLDGLITEREMANKIRKAAWEGMIGVELPSHDVEALGISEVAPRGWEYAG